MIIYCIFVSDHIYYNIIMYSIIYMSDMVRERESEGGSIEVQMGNNYYRQHFSFGPYRTDEYYIELRIIKIVYIFFRFLSCHTIALYIHEEKTL